MLSRARILQVCNTDFYLAKFLTPLVRGLVDAGYDVECVCEGDRVPLALGPRVVVHRVEFPRRGSVVGFARSIAALRRIIRAGKFDCVNSHNRNASIAGRVAAWVERVPVNLYTAHGFYFHDDQPRVTREVTIALEAALARLTDFTLSQSHEDLELMVGRHWIRADRSETIGNGIDTARFRPGRDRASTERELGLAGGKFRVAAVGRIVKGKGFSDLLRAFAKLRASHAEAELLMIGGNIDQDISPYQREFMAEVRELGVADSVVVTGMTDHVEKYLATANAFVLPSYREGMPRALLEAMAMELVVIATSIRGCKEIVTPGENGFLYPPHDVTTLARLLLDVRARQAELADVGRRARALVVARYDEKDYVARQVEAIERLLRERATAVALGVH
jgi:glycosyltransferase involved in cell wall biosynthesis